jgi:uncharacterized protein YqgC (DUF456 family)
LKKLGAVFKAFGLFLPKVFLLGFILGGIALVPLGLPGTWIIVGAAFLYSLFLDFSSKGSDFWVILTLILMAVVGEVIEFLVGTLGGKKFEVSTGAIIASFVGGILGAIIGVPVFLIGSLLGLLLGVFLGALIYELAVTKDWGVALKSAIAVFFSRLVASFMKTCIAVAMGIYLGFKIL